MVGDVEHLLENEMPKTAADQNSSSLTFHLVGLISTHAHKLNAWRNEVHQVLGISHNVMRATGIVQDFVLCVMRMRRHQC